MTFPYSLKTWADGFGSWHCEVNVSAPVVDIEEVRVLARNAIAEELAQRGNGAATEAYLASDRFRVGLENMGVATEDGTRYLFRELAESSNTKQDEAVARLEPLLATFIASINGTNEPIESNIADVLTDLHHLADAKGVNWELALSSGERNHEAESD
jgi:hypothetical protein